MDWGRRIGEDLLFPSLHSIENARCRGLGRGFRYLKTAVHIGVDGAENDGMDGALAVLDAPLWTTLWP